MLKKLTEEQQAALLESATQEFGERGLKAARRPKRPASSCSPGRPTGGSSFRRCWRKALPSRPPS